MSQTEEPQIIHVWVCQVRGTKETVSVRATRERAERWIEDQVDDPDAEWVEGPAAKDIYRSSGDATAAGLVSMCPVPDAIGLITEA